MPEPACALVRPTGVARSSLVTLTLLLLAAGGCGSASSPSAGGASTTSTSDVETSDQVGDCPAGSAQVRAARPLVSLDLNGDGSPEQVRLTAAGGACPNLLFADVGSGFASTPLPADAPPVRSAFGVRIPGADGDLVATREEHPRGGFQVRLFARDRDALRELEVDGRSLLPFVATDVQEHPLSIDCEKGGVVLTEAVPDEARGVAFAWQVRRTSYAVNGAEVTVGATDVLAESVRPGQLDKLHPELAGYELFKSCRTPES